jgi:hypothetical protein
MNKGKKILKIAAIAIVCVVLVGVIVMSLWNWLIPPILNGPEITFWQALGLFILAKILFGFGGGGRWKEGGARWKHRYYEKLSSMTPEERERFKEKLKEKWCSPGPAKHEPPTSSNV